MQLKETSGCRDWSWLLRRVVSDLGPEYPGTVYLQRAPMMKQAVEVMLALLGASPEGLRFLANLSASHHF